MGSQKPSLASRSKRPMKIQEVGPVRPPPLELFNNLTLLLLRSQALNWGGVGAQGGQRGGAGEVFCSWVSAVHTAEGDSGQRGQCY